MKDSSDGSPAVGANMFALRYPGPKGSSRRYSTAPVGRSPASNSKSVSVSMKGNKRTGTKPELILSRLLRKRITKNSLPGSPDMVYERQKVAIFVHGCFWHRCPICNLSLPKTHSAFWKQKFERNIERDRLNREELEAAGWRVLEVWEHEIRDHPKFVVQRIRSSLRRTTVLRVAPI